MGMTVVTTRRMLCLFWLTVSALAAVPSKAAKGNHPSAAQPNILLITLDTTRADRMGFLGSDRKLTPSLDALAKESIVFTHAYAQFPLTTASHATILTGTYPQFHHVNGFGLPLADDLPYAPSILHAHGYRTAAFIGSIILEARAAYAPGFDRGFDTYDAGYHNNNPGEDRYSTVQRRGSEVASRALTWLAKHPKGPSFVWVHLYDAHDPYDPPEPYKSRYPSQPYDGAIAYEDSVVGHLLRQLKLRGLYDHTVIAIAADHGESMGAHGEDTHGIFLYDETIRVPLLVKLPRGGAAGKQVENPVELVDLLPTMLQAVGVPVPEAVQGQSLLELVSADQATKKASGGWKDRPAYAESDYGHLTFGWSAEQSLRTKKYLYVEAPRRELYDQLADPKEENNLASASAAVADTFAAQTRDFRKKTASDREAPNAPLDPSAQEKLGALGYMAAVTQAHGDSHERGADPKDKIQLANMVHHAEVLHQDTHFDESIAILKEVMARQPDLPLQSKLGLWLMHNKQYREAVPLLRKAMEMDRESPMTHLHLAQALAHVDDLNSAIEEAEITEAKIPQVMDAHFLLQMLYTQANRPQEAIRECNFILESIPDHYPSYLILGRELDVSGETEAAIAALKKAAALDPTAPDPHLIMVEVYKHMGRKVEADRELAAAKRLGAKPEQLSH